MMTRRPNDPLRIPMIDLETVRETIAYIRDDLARVRGLEAAHAALGQALEELRAHDAGRQSLPRGILAARFLRRPGH